MNTFGKYPSTSHLPWSLGRGRGDRVWQYTDPFVGKEVVVTEKMDGENTSLYRDRVHARSSDSIHHESRSWVKGFHARVKHAIPVGCRVCGENLYARHSIAYDDLASYFYGFAAIDETGMVFSWDSTLELFKAIGIEPVPVIWRGVFDEGVVREVGGEYVGDCSKVEGYVVRLADSFWIEEFDSCVAKFVREGHVQTDAHWMHQKVVPNGLK